MPRADRIGGIGLLLLAALVVRESLHLPYWSDLAPGPGFLPFWFGVLLGVGSLPLVLSRRTSHVADLVVSRRDLGKLAALVTLSAVAVALMPHLGMVIVAGAFSLAVLSVLSPHRRRGNAIAAVLTPALVWLVFVYWLNVPLPRGPLGF